MTAQSLVAIDSPRPGKQAEFLAWAADIPYLVKYVPNGEGYFSKFTFVRADKDFLNTLADVPRVLAADPDDVEKRGGAMPYIEHILVATAEGDS